MQAKGSFLIGQIFIWTDFAARERLGKSAFDEDTERVVSGRTDGLGSIHNVAQHVLPLGDYLTYSFHDAVAKGVEEICLQGCTS